MSSRVDNDGFLGYKKVPDLCRAPGGAHLKQGAPARSTNCAVDGFISI